MRLDTVRPVLLLFITFTIKNVAILIRLLCGETQYAAEQKKQDREDTFHNPLNQRELVTVVDAPNGFVVPSTNTGEGIRCSR